MVKDGVGSVMESNINARGPRLVNLLPTYTRNTVGRPLDLLKEQPDSFLQDVIDETNGRIYDRLGAAASNSLVGHVLTREAWRRSELVRAAEST